MGAPPAGGVDGSQIQELAGLANALYAEIQRLAIEYEYATAGAKLAKDKAKALTS